jgi:hypothetical protein
VVIIGFSYGDRARQPVLYDYETLRSTPIERTVRNINWYMSDGPNLFPDKRYRPLVAHVPPSPRRAASQQMRAISLSNSTNLKRFARII